VSASASPADTSTQTCLRHLDGSGSQGMADIAHKENLEEAQDKADQEGAHQHELCGSITPVPHGQKPVTRVMACSNTPERAGPAADHMTTTRPAVMRVMSTHPGTSPRSGELSIFVVLSAFIKGF